MTYQSGNELLAGYGRRVAGGVAGEAGEPDPSSYLYPLGSTSPLFQSDYAGSEVVEMVSFSARGKMGTKT